MVQVCYHNRLRDSDYGVLGHGEAVSLRTPADKIPEIAALLMDRLFVKGIRADPQVRWNKKHATGKTIT
jgi:hypothetical protein